jgi:hypothetical protein
MVTPEMLGDAVVVVCDMSIFLTFRHALHLLLIPCYLTRRLG